MGIISKKLPIPADQQQNVFGQFDVFAKKIEKKLKKERCL